MENAQNIDTLFDKFLNRTCTREELHQLFAHFQTSDETILRTLIQEQIGKADSEIDKLTPAQQQKVQRVHEDLKAQLFHAKPTRSLFRRMLPYAAAVLLFLSVGIYFYTNRTIEPTSSKLTSIYGDDVAPGGNRATITLSDGTVVELNEHQEGVVADQTGLSYTDGKQVVETKNTVSYATLSTPRGGQYRLTLPDGTKVWLNAESEITYPLHFDDKERHVELYGEAYFEVRHKPEQPFIVKSSTQEIRVLGTSFNVRLYEQQSIQTTLVDGSVLVTLLNNISQPFTLTPGQQLNIHNGKGRVSNVKTSSYTSWKDGIFAFHDLPLSEVLLQIEKWYDVTIPHTDIPDTKIFGEINRNTKLSDVLELLETATHLKFELKERRLSIKK